MTRSAAFWGTRVVGGVPGGVPRGGTWVRTTITPGTHHPHARLIIAVLPVAAAPVASSPGFFWLQRHGRIPVHDKTVFS